MILVVQADAPADFEKWVEAQRADAPLPTTPPASHGQELVVTHPQILALVSELTEKRRSVVEAILQGLGEGHDGMSYV